MRELAAPVAMVIDGRPVPWARHVGLGASAHEKPRQKEFKRTLAWSAKAAGANRIAGFDRYHVRALIFLPIPVALRKAGGLDLLAAQREQLLCDDRPDLDNWLKLPLDAFNGVIWKDDAQVVSFDGSRRIYSIKPRLDLRIVPVDRRIDQEGGV